MRVGELENVREVRRLLREEHGERRVHHPCDDELRVPARYELRVVAVGENDGTEDVSVLRSRHCVRLRDVFVSSSLSIQCSRIHVPRQ